MSARSVLSVSKPRGLWRRATASPWLPRFPPIEAPSQKTLLWYEVFDNRRWLFGGAGIVFVLGYYLAPWSAVGRDPKGGAIIPLFQPPAGISPALANHIRDWGFGREKWRAFTAAALSLAVRGLLRFDDRSSTLTLTRIPPARCRLARIRSSAG